MHQADFLLAAAEIAIAFVAFGSLISVIGMRDGSAEQLIRSIRLVSVLILGLATVALCLLPFVIAEYGVSEVASFRIASAMVLVLDTAANLYLLRRNPPEMYKQRLPAALMFLLAAVASVLLLVITIGLVPDDRVASLYLTTVVLHLVGAAQFFYLIVVSMLLSTRA